MDENNLTADYYWERMMTAYRAFRQAYRDYRDAADQWNRFCAREAAARAARR